MAKSIRFSDDDFLDDVHAISLKNNRTPDDQIMHWARIGRAVERSGVIDFSKISRVLSGELETTVLNEVEKSFWTEQFVAKMSEVGPDEEAFFSELRKSGRAIGKTP